MKPGREILPEVTGGHDPLLMDHTRFGQSPPLRLASRAVADVGFVAAEDKGRTDMVQLPDIGRREEVPVADPEFFLHCYADQFQSEHPLLGTGVGRNATEWNSSRSRSMTTTAPPGRAPLPRIRSGNGR